MFNKIPFPGLPFYLNKHITQFKGKTYYPIYKSKKLEKFDFEFNKTVYDSIDSRPDFLKKINQLVPYDYDIVYDFYNRFRKMIKLNSPDKSKTGKSDVQESQQVYDDLYDDFENLEETNNIDSVTQNIILEYQNRLRTTVLRAEEAEKAVSDMYNNFNRKTAEGVELNKVIIDLKKELSDDRTKYENQQQMKYVEQIGQLENEIMLLKKRLVESNVFKTECESNGISIGKLKNDNVKKEQESFKLRSLNDGLMKQVKMEKDRSDKLSEDIGNLMGEIRDKDDKIREYVKHIDSLDSSLKKAHIDNNKISNKLKKMGESSDNYLEKALSDKIENLESSKSELDLNNRELMRDNRRLNIELSKIKNMMAGFIN
jgi:chromosome segregation ATPase